MSEHPADCAFCIAGEPMAHNYQPQDLEVYPTEALRLAAAKGKEHGKDAATWLFDGNTDAAYYAAFAKGLDDGDAEWVDKVPSADLSGQNADTYSSEDLRREFPDEDPEDLCRAYEEGWDAGTMDEINRVLDYQLGKTEGSNA